MEKLQRNPEKFDVLELYASMGLKIQNASSVDDFIARIRTSILASKNSDIVLFGKRIESLFAYVVGALGKVKLLKQEDSGNIYYKDVEVLAPDYKVIFDDDAQMLVEVKNCHLVNLTKKFSIKKDYYEKLKLYSDINKIPLKFAIYFSTINQWVLLDIDVFNEEDILYTINITTAMEKSEMFLFGDRMISTTPSLELHLLTDSSEAEDIESSGLVNFTIRRIKYFCAKKEVKEVIEQNILYYFIRFGTWIENTETIVEKGKLLGIKFIYSPSCTTEQGFETIGLLSGMISNKFKELTILDGKLEKLDLENNPIEFQIFIPENYESEVLPLWQFILKPNNS